MANGCILFQFSVTTPKEYANIQIFAGAPG